MRQGRLVGLFGQTNRKQVFLTRLPDHVSNAHLRRSRCGHLPQPPFAPTAALTSFVASGESQAAGPAMIPSSQP